MGIAALTAWILTASGGLYLLVVWLIEDDGANQGAAASRLPGLTVTSHLLLALGGLAIWVAHLVTGSQALAWWASALLVVVAALGVTMLARWIPVYRAPIPAVQVPGVQAPAAPVPLYAAPAVPAERNFPLVVVLAHGVLGASALLLVLLASLQAG
jgi:hypothetical protein